jgi:copper transport protein
MLVRQRFRLARGMAVVGALVAFSVLAPAAPAQAHAFLENSNPADGSVVATAPATLRLSFSESVVLTSMLIDLVDAHGRHVAPTAVRLQSAGKPGLTEDPVAIVADLPDLVRGVYRVAWETLSSDDLHRSAGVLVFGVGAGQSVQAAGLKEAQPRIDEASLRWLVLMSLALCLGGALSSLVLGRDNSPQGVSATRAATRWSLAGAAAGTVLTVLLLADQLAPGDTGARQLLFGWYGERWLLREVGFVLLLWSTLLVLRERMPRLRAWLFLWAAAMASVGTALLGHAGADTRLSVTRVAADAAHLAAATTWAGTLVVLTLVVGPRLLTGALGSGVVRGVLRSFGVPAAACVSVMVVTGVYLTSEVIGSVDAALLTTYGRVLLLKIVVAALGGALALVTHLRLRRRNPKALPRRAVAIEAGAAVVALGLAALLTSGQPALEPQFVSSPAAVPSQVVDGPVADLQESVSISPNLPGANVVMVSVFDTRRPSPGPVRAVLVSLVEASGQPGRPLAAEPLSDGRWSLSTPVAGPGPVDVQVLVRRAGLPDTVRSFGWTVGGGLVLTRPVVVSTAPVSEILRLTAALLVLLLVALWVLVPLIFRKGGIRWGRQALPSLVYEDRSPTGHRASERVPAGVGANEGRGS